MGAARLAVYLVGLVAVVAAAWILLTQTEIADVIPGGVAIAVILLVVGIGVMASAKSINDSRRTRRVVHEGGGLAVVDDRRVVREPPADGETLVEERRFD